MELFSHLDHSYRQFRADNRYDAPFLLFAVDTGIGIAKIAILGFALWLCWLLGYKAIASLEAIASSATETVYVEPLVSVQSAKQNEIPSNGHLLEREITPQIVGSIPDMVGVAWVNSLNPESFIIQFGSTVDPELLNEFVPAINRNEPIATYAFKRTASGRLVYGIATGVYNDLDTALASIEDLSPVARTYDPWVRPVKELIAEINAVNQN